MFPFIRSDLAQLIAYSPPIETQPLHSQTTPFDRLDTNESPYDLPDELKQKLTWIYQTEVEANRYPDGAMLPLKQAIAAYVNESAGLINPLIGSEHISVGNGSDELIRSLLIATCLGGAGSILVAEPTFSMYAILARTLGIPVVAVGRSTDNFEMDVSAAQRAIAQTQNPPIRVVFVVHPNSPTGNALTQVELTWLRSLPEHILVVIDEAYFEFSQVSVVGELLQHPNWVVLRTFSKAFRLAAHRVGYAIAHPSLITTLEKIRLPYNLPTFSQIAALTALACRAQLFHSIPEMIEQRIYLTQALAEYSILQVWPSAANFVYIRLLDKSNLDLSLHKIFQQLKTAGTQIRYIDDGFRITVGSPDENERTLKRLQAALK